MAPTPWGSRGAKNLGICFGIVDNLGMKTRGWIFFPMKDLVTSTQAQMLVKGFEDDFYKKKYFPGFGDEMLELNGFSMI